MNMQETEEAILEGEVGQDLAMEKGHGVRGKGRERQGQPTGFWLRKKRGCSVGETGGFALTLAVLRHSVVAPLPHLSRAVPHYFTARTYCTGRSHPHPVLSVGQKHLVGWDRAWGSFRHPLCRKSF